MTEEGYKVGYKKPPVGKTWQKGQSGNPGGITKKAKELMAARKLTKQVFEEKLQEFMKMPMADLENIVERYKADAVPCLDMLVGSIIVKAIMEGCVTRMNFLLSRMGVNAEFAEHDPTLNMNGENQASVDAAPFYIVELNRGGKFIRSRPREVLLEERKALEGETRLGE